MRGERIVTLLPSATEIVCGLGLQDRLVGITHECDYPAAVTGLPRVTRSAIDINQGSLEIDAAVREHLETSNALYTIDIPLLSSLEPDLLVTQALCDVCAVSEGDVLAAICELPDSPELINLEPMSLQEVFDTISLVGAMTEVESAAADYVESLQARVDAVSSAARGLQKPRVGFLEWIDPPFNGGHWTPELIELAGGVDCFGSKHEPSRTIEWDILFEADPDVLIIALCGFGGERAMREVEELKQKVDLTRLRAVQDDRLHILDGNSYFSRPGPRLVDALEILFRVLHP